MTAVDHPDRLPLAPGHSAGLDDGHRDPNSGVLTEKDLEALGQARPVYLGIGRLALDAHLVHSSRAFDDQAVVGAHLLDAEEQRLDGGREKVDARMISMSSSLPRRAAMRASVRPQAQGSVVSEPMSPVRYRIRGWASLAGR